MKVHSGVMSFCSIFEEYQGERFAEFGFLSICMS